MPKKEITLEKLAQKMDQGFQGVNKRLDVVEKKIGKEVGDLAISTAKEFNAHDRRFDLIDSKLNNHDRTLEQFGKAILNLLDDTKDIKENMVLKKDIDNISILLDKQTVILKTLDQERIFNTEWLKRLDKDVEKLKSK